MDKCKQAGIQSSEDVLPDDSTKPIAKSVYAGYSAKEFDELRLKNWNKLILQRGHRYA